MRSLLPRERNSPLSSDRDARSPRLPRGRRARARGHGGVLAPCGVGASGFDAAAQGRARARETHRHRRAPIAPRLTSLSPLRARRAAARVLTITGVGFEDTAGLAVRFAASRGAPDGGPLLHTTRARFVSRTKIECVAPRIALRRPTAHVSASNGDGVWSAPPLVHVRSGATSISNSALLLEYEEVTPGCPAVAARAGSTDPAPERRARRAVGRRSRTSADKGGSLITIRAVGYALNDFDDPHNTTLAFDVRDVDDALPPGFAALSAARPGGPGSRGRGGAARRRLPTAATFGARPRGTFFPGPGLRCRFECPVLRRSGTQTQTLRMQSRTKRSSTKSSSRFSKTFMERFWISRASRASRRRFRTRRRRRFSRRSPRTRPRPSRACAASRSPTTTA